MTLAQLCPHCQGSTTNPDSTRAVSPVGYICTWKCTKCTGTWVHFVMRLPKRAAA